jgi:dienelactone hydrolase
VDVPLSLALGDRDSLLDAESVERIKEVMETSSSPSEVRIYEGQVLGFALRSDWSSEMDKKAMDEAEKQGIDFFRRYLS